jgi:hypothetical protein
MFGKVPRGKWFPQASMKHIAEWLNGAYGWLQVKCHRCEIGASIPLDANRRPRDTPI